MSETTMDEELEKQYAPSQWAKSSLPEQAVEDYAEFVVSESNKVTEAISDVIELNYGETDEQKIDVFGHHTLPEDAPIIIYVHGGYWVFGCLKDSRFFVIPFYKAGILCAPLGYDLVSSTVTLPDIIQQVQNGINTVLKYAKKRNSRGVYICGYSAGGHLIMSALSGTESENYDIIRGVISISGLFDLHPILRTTNAPAARITKEISERCSPLHFVEQLKENLPPHVTIAVYVAEHESESFHKQSEVYAKALKNIGMNSKYKIVENEDHFSIIMKLSNSEFSFTKELIKLICEDCN